MAGSMRGGAPTPGDHGQATGGGSHGNTGNSGGMTKEAERRAKNIAESGARVKASARGNPNATGQPYTPGATPFIPDPSPGQVLGTMVTALGPYGTGTLNSLGDEPGADVTTGGFVGQGIDAAGGWTPGKQGGWSPDRDRNNLGGPSGGGVMLSPGAAALVGDTPSGTPGADAIGYDYTDAPLQDVPQQLRNRRRMAGAAMLVA